MALVVDRNKRRRERQTRARTPNLRGPAVRQEFNVLALFKGAEVYVYLYDDASRTALIDAFRNQAADPAVNFTWFDVAVMTEKAREQAREQKQTQVQPTPPSRSRI
jgi:hypothetical protein